VKRLFTAPVYYHHCRTGYCRYQIIYVGDVAGRRLRTTSANDISVRALRFRLRRPHHRQFFLAYGFHPRAPCHFRWDKRAAACKQAG